MIIHIKKAHRERNNNIIHVFKMDSNVTNYSSVSKAYQNNLQIPLALRRSKVKQEKNKDSDGRRRKARAYVEDDLDDVPLKNIKKEVKHDDTVSLERFYYGRTTEGLAENIAIAVQVTGHRYHIQ